MNRLWTRISLVIVLVLSMTAHALETSSAHPLGTTAFERTWARTDQPVAAGQANRTWMWGPSGHTSALAEPYSDAPGGNRLVQYTDKSRMEDNSYRASAPWDVTNGRLAYELITGNMQLGDHDFEQRSPSTSQIAGDSHPDSPTYLTFNGVMGHDPHPGGWTITETIDQDGNIGSDSNLGQHGVTAEHLVPDTDHRVASVFWEFMNSSGTVYENGQYRNDNLFENPFFATGFPITEAYWMNVPVGGQRTNVLAQCFERRCLTYNPSNSAGWQVEAGNIGQHYYQWRHGDSPAPPPPPPPDPSEVEYAENLLVILEATVISFEVFDILLANPTFTVEWYDHFDDVMEIWLVAYYALDSLDPPPGYEAFHSKLLDAYWQLNQAAEEFIVGFYYFDEWALERGLGHLEEFIRLFEEAVDLMPGQIDDPVLLEHSDSMNTFIDFDAGVIENFIRGDGFPQDAESPGIDR